MVRDCLFIDDLGNYYLCGRYAAYASGNLINFEPRIDDYIIELKHLIDTSTFRTLEYPVFGDTNYFYSFRKMAEGGTISVFEANKKNKVMFEGYIDSLKENKNVR